VTYRERQRLADIQAAIDAIGSHLQRGDLSDALVFDAVRIRLLEIGEAVKALPAEMLNSQPSIPWSQIARMRDHLAHRYFDSQLPPAARWTGDHPRAAGPGDWLSTLSEVSAQRLIAASQMTRRSHPGSPMPCGWNWPDNGAYAYQPVLTPRPVR